ncbi:MAG: rubredoxin-like domain-containing protein [bacterium]
MQWTCGICGYLHDEGEVPSVCPVCGASRSKFTEYFDDDNNIDENEALVRRRNKFDDYYGDYDE